MKKALFILSMPLLFTACEQSRDAGDETVREISGSNMMQQGRQMQQQLHGINEQQKERYEQLDQQQ